MRVAMIISTYPKLSEKFLRNQVEGLIRAGVDLDVYSVHDFVPSGPIASTLTVGSNVHYAGVPLVVRERAIDAPRAILNAFAAGPFAVLRTFNAARYTTAAKNLKLPYFARAFAGKKYDVIHCHFGPNGLIGTYLADCGFAPRLVVSFHGSDINSYPSRYGRGVYRAMYERADVVTSNTNFTNDKVVANGCPREKTAIIPECLAVDEYPLADPAGRENCTILTVGRLVEKKGHRYTLEAVATLAPKYPNLEYIVAGDGPLRSGLEAYAAELGIADRTRFLGACDYATVKELYASATIFTLPSVTASNGDREGQGLVLQEAQARGLPVVTTWHNGIPDGVRDGETGYLVEEKDSAALADRLATLLDDSRLRARMGTAGRDFVASNYDTKIIADRLRRFYENA